MSFNCPPFHYSVNKCLPGRTGNVGSCGATGVAAVGVATAVGTAAVGCPGWVGVGGATLAWLNIVQGLRWMSC